MMYGTRAESLNRKEIGAPPYVNGVAGGHYVAIGA
jgi:hypothetical protein